MIEKFKNTDGFEQILVLFMLLITISLTIYGFSDKKFNGYYLDAGKSAPFMIKINWENAPDETAYKSFDKDQIMIIYKQLKAEENKQK